MRAFPWPKLSLHLFLAASALLAGPIACTEQPWDGPAGAQAAAAHPENGPVETEPAFLVAATPVGEAVTESVAPSAAPTPDSLVLAYTPLPDDLSARAATASSFPQASQLLRELEYRFLTPEVRTNPSTGIRYITYRLPEEAAGNEAIKLVLGNHLPTRFRERLPQGVAAVVAQLPGDTVAALGPFIWTSVGQVSRQLYGQDAALMYRHLGYPETLLAEIYVQDPFTNRRLPFRPTDRIGGFTGQELAAGTIAGGTLYVYVDPAGGWRLVEYPDVPPEGDLAHLMWNFNPVSPRTGRREFTIPTYLRQSQQGQQAKTLRTPASPQDNVGPSVILRTDRAKDETDIVTVPAYLYLDNPELLRDILYRTPLPSGSLPDPNELLVGAGDLHYVSNGKIGPLLSAEAGGSTMGAGVEPRRVRIEDVRNHTGLYLGLRRQ